MTDIALLAMCKYKGRILYTDMDNDPSKRLYFFCEINNTFPEGSEHRFIFQIRGWMSGVYGVTDVLLNILRDPKKWKIHPYTGGYPYPWSSRYKGVHP